MYGMRSLSCAAPATAVARPMPSFRISSSLTVPTVCSLSSASLVNISCTCIRSRNCANAFPLLPDSSINGWIYGKSTNPGGLDSWIVWMFHIKDFSFPSAGWTAVLTLPLVLYVPLVLPSSSHMPTPKPQFTVRRSLPPIIFFCRPPDHAHDFVPSSIYDGLIIKRRIFS